MAVFKGGYGRDDYFFGTEASDTFVFAPTDLTSGDKLVGGGGTGIDTLQFSAAGAITADQLANVSGIERIRLADGANSLEITGALVGTAAGQRIAIRGGSGANAIDASTLNAFLGVDILTGVGADTLKGGAGADTFTFALTALTKDDTVAGGGGIDTLRFLDGGLLTVARFAGVSGIETIALSDQATKAVLADAMFRDAGDRVLSVVGGAGNDTIDARGLHDRPVPYALLKLEGGAGDDVIAGPGKPSSPYYPIDTFVDGGVGRDTIVCTVGVSTVVYDKADIREYVAVGTLLLNGAATIDLTRGGDQSLNDQCDLRGFTDVDASGSNQGVTVTGQATSRLIGGAGSDTLTYGANINGGAGADHLYAIGDNAVIEVDEGDFATGETVLGIDYQLYFDGSANLSNANVGGFRYLTMGRGESNAPNALTVDDTAVASLYYLSGTGRLVIGVGADHLANLHGLTNFGGDQLAITVQGTASQDTITSALDATVYGGAGNDTISATGSIYGQGGNDRIEVPEYGSVRLIDGGDGIDTLVYAGRSSGLHVDLTAADQTTDDAAIVHGMENVDFSKTATPLFCVGSAGANVLSGGAGDDSISGAGGNDTLTGGDGNDTLTGGTGTDRFVWTGTVGADTVADFTAGQDKLVFDRVDDAGQSVFDVNGDKFDKRVVASTTTTNIAGADLVVYTAGTLDTAGVTDFLRANGTGSHGEGLFITAENSAGHAMLWYVPDAGAATPIATLAVDLMGFSSDHLMLTSFAFI